MHSCVDCQRKEKPPVKPAGLLKSIVSGQPFERVGVHLIGHFPLSRSGKRHTIVAVDNCTKWVIAKAVPSADARQLVELFIKRFVLQHSEPVYLLSDRRKSLSSDWSKELYKARQTNHLMKTPYHPQCNELVERFNHAFAEMLSMYVSFSHNDWDEAVDFVTFSYNTRRQESTRLISFFMLYGREAVLLSSSWRNSWQ